MQNFVFPFLLGCSLASNGAQQIHLQSDTNHTALLELYTSEGCSSCPSAEGWFSKLKSDPRLWKEFVPVAFHVDYWDYLGWRDPFGASDYSQRQRDYAAEWKSRSIYTPGFVLDGNEWRNWSGRDKLSRVSSQPAGILKADSQNGKQWSVSFESAGTKDSTIAFHAALLGFDLLSDVKTGENRGRKLQHDFVLLTLANAKSKRKGDAFQAELNLNLSTIQNAKRLGVAVWATQPGKLEPVQAIGGWLPPGQ